MKAKQKLLLLQDVDGLGRSGDIVNAKRGYVRNYLLPQKKAVFADPHTLKMQSTLKEAREKQAVVDRKEAEELAAKLADFSLFVDVKVDPEGNMYGSVSTLDIAELMKEKGYEIERKNIMLPQPIKTVGSHKIPLRLKEGVGVTITVEVAAEVDLQSQQTPA